ncbi:MAG TPA: ankyrin repeat domain-containing protein [Candidatus Limnocylindria bacterium]|nr:ankyrin repeat domain-containing protein [Candidatus Limnocylindria bacterium]
MSRLKSFIIALLVICSAQPVQAAFATPFPVSSGITKVVAYAAGFAALTRFFSSWLPQSPVHTTTPGCVDKVAIHQEKHVKSFVAAHVNAFASPAELKAAAQEIARAKQCRTATTSSSPSPANPQPAHTNRATTLAAQTKGATAAATIRSLNTTATAGTATSKRRQAVLVDRRPTPKTLELFAAFNAQDVPKVYSLFTRNLNELNVHARDQDRNTPAHIAALCNLPSIVRRLKKRGASMTTHNKDGYSPRRLMLETIEEGNEKNIV